MTQDEIMEMARQAGMAYEEKLEVYVANIDDLQDFAKLVAAKEREACAKLCDSHKSENFPLIHNNAVVGCSFSIRARGEA
jgi:hypothetical protein